VKVNLDVFEEGVGENTKLSVVICATPQRVWFLHSAITNVLKQNYPCELLVVTDIGYSDYIRRTIPPSILI